MLEQARHVFPTDFDGEGNGVCGEDAAPYVANCGYDGAGEVLRWLYGAEADLKARRRVEELEGRMVEFEQKGEFGGPGLGRTGYVFVPRECEDMKTECKLHVALHGCTQGYEQIGELYVQNTGYREWAGEYYSPISPSSSGRC